MYIMCVILCLFSALTRRIGALHISIVSINRTALLPKPHKGAKCYLMSYANLCYCCCCCCYYCERMLNKSSL